MKEPLTGLRTGQLRIGSHHSGQHFWNGHVYFCVINDRPLGGESWKKYLQDRDLSPNPFDADRLRLAMGRHLT